MGDNVNEAGEPVELFGTLELVLSEDNSTGYKDVFYLKDRKKKPYQAKIWRPDTKDHINLGTFRGKHEAAVAVAQFRRDGREDQPSPDKRRAEKSTSSPARAPPDLHKYLCNSLIATFGCTEKQKLKAAATIDSSVPPTFQGYENWPLQLPVAQLQAWSASSSAHVFATGAVAVALPAHCAVPAPMSIRPLSLLADGGRLTGR